jgi:uncharacterized phage protein gp47/JayE
MQIKDFTSIVASMVNHMRSTQGAVTDYNVGSAARTLIEAPAIEMEEMYLQFLQGVMDAIPISVYQAWSFTRNPAISATGVLTLWRTNTGDELTIQAGTVFAIPATDRRYVSVSDAVMEIGEQSTSVMVRSLLPGSAGNTIEGTITLMIPGAPGVSVSNLAPVNTGRDEETDTEMRLRFAAYVRALARGTSDAIRFIALQGVRRDSFGAVIESARRVSLFESIPGRVYVYVYNGFGGTSPELCAEVLRLIDGYRTADGIRVPGYRAAGIEVLVQPMREKSIDVLARLSLQPGTALEDVRPMVSTILSGLVRDLEPGKILFLSRLAASALEVPGVAGVDIEMPEANVVPSPDEVLVPGSITVLAG